MKAPLISIQSQLANSICEKYKDAVVKKIDVDNYLDIHIPSLNKKKGTHLGVNTSKNVVKMVFYCRDEDFVQNVLSNSKVLEEYSKGIRPLGDPSFGDISEALKSIFDFLLEIQKSIDGEQHQDLQIDETNTDEIINKFVENQGIDNISEFLENYIQDSQIVVLEIAAVHLMNAVAVNDLTDNLKIVGIVHYGKGIWEDLAKVIGDVEADWAKNEYSDENPSGMVLLYCEGKYVFAYTESEEESEERTIFIPGDDSNDTEEQSVADIMKDLGFDEDWKEESEEDGENKLEEESEEDEDEDETLGLGIYDFDDHDLISNAVKKIKKLKALPHLPFIYTTLEKKGFEIDRHNPHFFTSYVLISDQELSGFLFVNMDGFHSDLIDGELNQIFSWDSITDIEKIHEDEESISINLVSSEGKLTISEPYSKNLLILLELYRSVWVNINKKFAGKNMIFWNEVEDMGIKLLSFDSQTEYLNWINEDL
jgi:hypothetical protein